MTKTPHSRAVRHNDRHRLVYVCKHGHAQSGLTVTQHRATDID